MKPSERMFTALQGDGNTCILGWGMREAFGRRIFHQHNPPVFMFVEFGGNYEDWHLIWMGMNLENPAKMSVDLENAWRRRVCMMQQRKEAHEGSLVAG